MIEHQQNVWCVCVWSLVILAPLSARAEAVINLQGLKSVTYTKMSFFPLTLK
jgi:hypothetical protein